MSDKRNIPQRQKDIHARLYGRERGDPSVSQQLAHIQESCEEILADINALDGIPGREQALEDLQRQFLFLKQLLNEKPFASAMALLGRRR